jgi:uncharacterized membrane-anchored protein YjiN (DUF445 family)
MKANDDLKRARVRQMKALALTLLIAMLGLLWISAAYRPSHPWLGWVFAFAEAAAVGAIADWFAVTALFRHPLGLPIPHTAIIPRNKDAIGASLGQFVEHNFLTPENVIQKLVQKNLARTCGEWLADSANSGDLAKRICSYIPALLEKLDDEDVRRFLDQALLSQLERLDLSRITGKLLDMLTAGGRHQELLDHALKALDRWLDQNRAPIKAKFGEASRYTPRFIDQYIVNKFVDGILLLLHEVAEDPAHEIRARFDQATRDLIVDLQTSDAHRERGADIARQLVEHLRRESYYRSLWAALTRRIVDDIASDDSVLVEHVATALAAAGRALRADVALQDKLNLWALAALERLMLRHRHQVSTLITDVVKSWDAREVSEKIEMEIGRDLQYIRLNGTVVGGLAGVVLYAATQIIA